MGVRTDNVAAVMVSINDGHITQVQQCSQHSERFGLLLLTETEELQRPACLLKVSQIVDTRNRCAATLTCVVKLVGVTKLQVGQIW